MTMNNTKENLVYETAKIEWSELQRFYAQGNVMHVASELDLVVVATAFSNDDVESVSIWNESGQVNPVEDAQALHWIDSDAVVWAVTIAPFILVQSVDENSH